MKDFQTSTVQLPAASETTLDLAFHFGIDILDDSINHVHKHTVSSNIQISSVTILCLSYVCAYIGLKGCESYLFDLSHGAAGKDSAFDKASELILGPVIDAQNIRKANYDHSRQGSDENLPVKSYHCIHTSDATEQGIIIGFETTKAQLIAIGETSNKLRKKEDPLMNFITRLYGKKNIMKPNYKKDLGSGGDLNINDISIFFYGNSNFQMLGKNIFTHHLVGGSINRCVLVFNTKARPFEERPESYDLPESVIKDTHETVKYLMAYGAESASKVKPKLVKTDEYIAFDKYIYDLTNMYAGSEIEYLFKRVMQNLNAFIYTFHYLKNAQDGVCSDEIDATTVSLGINYMKYVLEGYNALIDELIGASAEVREEDNIAKLHAVILSLANKKNVLKLKHRDVYRAAHLTRKQYDKYIFGMRYKTDKKFLHVLPELAVTFVTGDKTKEVA